MSNLVKKLNEYRDILKIFYMTSTRALLVIQSERLVGLVLKEDVIRFSSNIELVKKHISIIISFLIKGPSDSRLSTILSENEELPAIDVKGNYLGMIGTAQYREPDIELPSQDILSRMIDLFPDPMLLVNLEGEIKYFNSSFKVFAGNDIRGLSIDYKLLKHLIKNDSLVLEIDSVERIFYKFGFDESNLIVLLGRERSPASVKKAKTEKIKRNVAERKLKKLEDDLKKRMADIKNREKELKKQLTGSAIINQSGTRELKKKDLASYLDAIEKVRIEETFNELGGNVSKAADRLGIPRQTLQYKLSKYKIKKVSTPILKEKSKPKIAKKGMKIRIKKKTVRPVKKTISVGKSKSKKSTDRKSISIKKRSTKKK
ncbi:MAG: hypothetical protein KAS39_05610 [Actinomycetia bacterium]|nr:hypothetical protein [Actinomycetes bacterium]